MTKYIDKQFAKEKKGGEEKEIPTNQYKSRRNRELLFLTHYSSKNSKVWHEQFSMRMWGDGRTHTRLVKEENEPATLENNLGLNTKMENAKSH